MSDIWSTFNTNAPAQIADAFQQRKVENARRNAMLEMAGQDPTMTGLAQAGDLEGFSVFRAARQQEEAEAHKRQLEQAEQAREHLKVLGQVAYSVRQYPYEQRKAVIAGLKPQLLTMGMQDADIDTFDPSDANIDGMLGTVLDLDKQIELSLKQQNTQSMIDYRDASLDERGRHNRTMEGYTGARVGLAQQREGRVAANAGRKSGGRGRSRSVPPPPPGFVLE